MLYTSLVSFEVLLLSKHELYPPTTQILPRFLDAMPFFPRKVQDLGQDFGALNAYFRPQSLVIHEGKDSGNDEFLQFRHADLFSGGSPEARLNFSARGSRNLLLHGKNRIIGPRAKFTSAVPKMNRELKHATFLRHGRQPEVNISRARTVVFSRFSN